MSYVCCNGLRGSHRIQPSAISHRPLQLPSKKWTQCIYIYNCWKKSKLKSYVRPCKGRNSCLWIKSVFDCLTIGIIHETMVVHMTWVWTFFNNYSNHPRNHHSIKEIFDLSNGMFLTINNIFHQSVKFSFKMNCCSHKLPRNEAFLAASW